MWRSKFTSRSVLPLGRATGSAGSEETANSKATNMLEPQFSEHEAPASVGEEHSLALRAPSLSLLLLFLLLLRGGALFQFAFNLLGYSLGELQLFRIRLVAF